MKFFIVILSHKENLHLKKTLTQRLRKFITKWKIGEKWLMHDVNKAKGKGVWCSLCNMRQATCLKDEVLKFQ